MKTTLPTEARVDLESVDLSDNLVGLIEGVHAIMSYVLADEMPEALSRDELLCVSGAAFKNYVYEPAYNQLENPQSFSKLGEFVCNYGPFESLSYYSGWDVKEFNEIARNDFWKLLQYEIASGRPVLTLGTAATTHPLLVVGYHYEPRQQSLDVLRPGSAGVETIDVTGVQDFQEHEASYTNWLLIARPSEQPEWASSRTRQRLRVLRWTLAHARRHKEFSQETRENYAPGLRGFESFLELVDAWSDSGQPAWSADAARTRYVAAHVDGLRRARHAASERLADWASDFIAADDIEIAEPERASDALSDAADAYERVCEPLSQWQQDWGGGELTTDDLEALWRAYSEASKAEEEAIKALAEGLKVLPKGL